MQEKLFINESSTGHLIVTFRDRDGQPSVPNTATYKIHNLTNDSFVKPVTPIEPLQAVSEIELRPGETLIADPKNQQETSRVTIEATYGNGDEIVEQIDYIVINMSEVP